MRSALQTPDLSEFFLSETILVHDDEMPSYLFCACQVGIAKWALGWDLMLLPDMPFKVLRSTIGLSAIDVMAGALFGHPSTAIRLL